jgi:hypothetical protein
LVGVDALLDRSPCTVQFLLVYLEAQLAMFESRLFEIGREPRVFAEQGEPLVVRPQFAVGFQSDPDLQHVSVGDAQNPPRAELDHHVSPPVIGFLGDSASGESLLQQPWCGPRSAMTPRFSAARPACAARCKRIAVGLLDDPGVSRVGFDSADGGHLCDEQLASCSVELVPDRRSASFDTLALSVCAVPDDLGKTANSAAHEFGLRISVAPRPMLTRRWRVATKCALHLLQLRLAG